MNNNISQNLLVELIQEVGYEIDILEEKITDLEINSSLRDSDRETETEHLAQEVEKLENLQEILIALLWGLHYDFCISLVKDNLIAQPDIDPWRFMNILAVIYFETNSHREYVYVPSKGYNKYGWYPHLIKLVKKISKISMTQRYKLLKLASERAKQFYDEMVSFLQAPINRELYNKLNDTFTVYWYSLLISAFGINYKGEELIEKIEILYHRALELEDDELVFELDLIIGLLSDEEDDEDEDIELGPFLLGSFESLPPRERAYLEEFMEQAEALRHFELDQEYIRNHAEDFALIFGAQIIGIENVVTISALFRHQKFIQSPVDDEFIESYYSLSWTDLPSFFNINPPDRESLEQADEKDMLQAADRITHECMAYIIETLEMYKVNDIYLVMPKRIDGDFERLHIKEKSGLSKIWREKLGEIIKAKLEEKATKIGIAVAQVPISLEEQMRDYFPDEDFFRTV